MENQLTVNKSARDKSALHNGSGVVVKHLMHQCTTMLREQMWTAEKKHSKATPPPPALRYRDSNGAAPPDNALEAMGPVLESVLGSLTTEYERRLLLKDQEIKTTMDELNKCRSQIQQLEQRLLAGAAQPRLEYHMSEEQRGEIVRLKSAEAELMQQLVAGRKDSEALATEYDRMKESNHRLEITCEQYRLKLEANMGLLNNYKTMQDENRKLYNQIQDLRGNIRVFLRVRPCGATGDSAASCVTMGSKDEPQVALYNPKDGRRSVFAFDKIFDPDDNQETVYLETQPLIRSVVDGFNVCIFAYGQTGSGKTHTMAGTNVEQSAGRGINYRALDDLFDLQHQRASEVKYDIKVQMLEVYNEKIRDLLTENRGTGLDIQNTKTSGSNVPDALQVVVSCTLDVLDVMKQGQSNRATADTKMNERSSRSHSVLTVIVDGENSVTGTMSHGCLHLIDLAGSERVGRSEASGDRLEEAKHINKSLSAIGDVMSALASKSKHIPFRNSKLTQLLADSLSGQAKVMMFLHVSPEHTSFSESLSTLKFGSRVSEITLGQAKRNIESGSTLDVKEAQALYATQRELMHQKRELERQMQQRQEILNAEQFENERLRVENAEKDKQMRALQAQLQATNHGTQRDHVFVSPPTLANVKRSTPRLAPPCTPEVQAEARSEVQSAGSSTAPPGSMTAEEKHIRRMRVNRQAESASGLPRRPRTALGATSVSTEDGPKSSRPGVRASMPNAADRTRLSQSGSNGKRTGEGVRASLPNVRGAFSARSRR